MERSRLHWQTLPSVPCYGLAEQKRKEPKVSVYLVPPIRHGKGLRRETVQATGAEVGGGQRAGFSALDVGVGSQLMSGSLMESGLILSGARAMPTPACNRLR